MVKEQPAKGIKGFFLWSPFDKEYFFRVYDSEDKRKFIDYDLSADEIEVELTSNFNSLYNKEEKSYISYSSKVLGRKPKGEQMDEMQCKDLTVEQWREYDFEGRVYRIDNPVKLYTRPNGTTHRVVDAEGVVHCLPAPGMKGCVLKWKSVDPKKPVEF